MVFTRIFKIFFTGFESKLIVLVNFAVAFANRRERSHLVSHLQR